MISIIEPCPQGCGQLGKKYLAKKISKCSTKELALENHGESQQPSLKWRRNWAQSHIPTFPGLQPDTNHHPTLLHRCFWFWESAGTPPPDPVEAGDFRNARLQGAPVLLSGFAGSWTSNCPKPPLLLSLAVSCFGDTSQPLLCPAETPTQLLLTGRGSHPHAQVLHCPGATIWLQKGARQFRLTTLSLEKTWVSQWPQCSWGGLIQLIPLRWMFPGSSSPAGSAILPSAFVWAAWPCR